MKYADIYYDDIANGEGVRAVLFVSGCNHKCKGCHNKKTWDFNYGEEFTIEQQNEIIEYCKREYVSGITVSGGDPMYSAKELILFVKRFKKECPDKDIWIYSGFDYMDILEDKNMKSLLKLCDVLVDGPYKKELKDETLSFKGSYNQRIIDIRASLSLKSIINWASTFS